MDRIGESSLAANRQDEFHDSLWLSGCILSSNCLDRSSTMETETVASLNDSGGFWDQDKLPLPDSLKPFDSISEPSIATNLSGKLHVAVTASDSQGSNNPRGGLFIMTSKNGDKWDRVAHVFNNNDSASAESPSIACDTTEMIGSNKNPYRNRLYAAWIVKSTPDASTQFSEVLFAESVDGGNTFGVPVVGGKWSFIPSRLDTGKSAVSSPSVEVDDSGKLTVSWNETNPRDGKVTRVSRSSNSGGVGFGPVTRKD